MHTAKIPYARIRHKRNVARRILLRSRERLLWLWPQYFPKHDMATARLKTYSLDAFERECDLAEAGAAKRPVSPAVLGTRHPGSFSQGFEWTVAQPHNNARATAAEHVGNQKTWSNPGWREAARHYHAARGRRLLLTEIQGEQIARFRRLLSDNTSLDRVWRELNEHRDRPAPQATFDALLYELRTLGIAVLKNPSCRRRLADLSDPQLREVLAALIRTRARYPAITDELLIALDEIRR
jgi:hypothetical protein